MYVRLICYNYQYLYLLFLQASKSFQRSHDLPTLIAHIPSSSSLKLLLQPDLLVKSSQLISSCFAYCQVTVGREQISSSPSVNSSCRLPKKTRLEQQDILKLFAISTLKTCFYRLVSLFGFFFIKRHTKNFGLLPFALLPQVFSLCSVTSLSHFLVFHPSNLYSLLSLFPLCVCAFVFSYICLFQASLFLFTSATFFFSYLGSCVALGHAISDCIKFPITFSTLRP